MITTLVIRCTVPSPPLPAKPTICQGNTICLYISGIVVYTSRMSNHDSDEKRVPLSIVFMSVGLVVIGTAVAIWLLTPNAQQQLPQLLQVATIPTAEANGEGAQILLLPETSTEELPPNYVSAANYSSTGSSGQPQRILIPAIDVDAPVSGIGLAPIEVDGETYYQWQVPNEYRAGWHNTSARLGEVGNTVLNGHNNIFGEVFRDLEYLQEGDEITVYDNETPFVYTITQIEILPEQGQPIAVRQENAQWILPTEDERLTLISCWPYESNTHRLVVVAKPTSDNASDS